VVVIIIIIIIIIWARGSVVEALCYESEGRRFHSRRGLRIFLVDLFLPVALVRNKPVTEMRTRYSARCKGQPERNADLTAVCEPVV
jgi:hypothetical protein